jgi:integrase
MQNGKKPAIEIGTVGRKHILPQEFEALIQASATNRWATRDQIMLRFTYRHGLRVSELCALTWGDIDFTGKTITIWRRKARTASGTRPNVHPLDADEVKALKSLRKQYGDESDFIFASERRGDDGRFAGLTTNGVGKMLRRLGEAAGVTVCNPHSLRHGCAQRLADNGNDAFLIRDALGHANVQTSNAYVAASPERLRGAKW